MATFTLYHLKPEHTRDAYTFEGAFGFKCYDLVATLEVPALGAVFQYSNHGVPGQPDNWTENPEVTKLFSARPRSTSVGDLIVDEFGQGYQVAGAGFTPVTVPLSASKAAA